MDEQCLDSRRRGRCKSHACLGITSGRRFMLICQCPHIELDGMFRLTKNNVVAWCLRASQRQRQPTGIGWCDDYFPHLQKPPYFLSGTDKKGGSHGRNSFIQRRCRSHLPPNAIMSGNGKDWQKDEGGDYSRNAEECFLHEKYAVRLWRKRWREQRHESGLGRCIREIRTGG